MLLLQYFHRKSTFFSFLITSLFMLFQENLYSQTSVTINADSTHQIIRGFGAANIVGWRPDMTDTEIEKAFGTEDDQLGFSLLRIRVPYSENDFYINKATCRSAYSKGVSIIASPWTPPANMKSNNNIVGGRLDDSSYADYAAHLKSFVDYMADNDAPLYAISVQNEPDIEVEYESCDWTASEMKRFVKEDGASIGTKIIAPESYNFNKTISDSILVDSAAAANVSIIGGHLYGGGLEKYPLAEEKGKEIWMTEYLTTDTTWASTQSVAGQINNCMKYGMSAYIWWYIVRFYGPIGEDGNITKRGYAMSQFSRFLRPGFVRIQTDYQWEIAVNVSFSAYKSDSSLVIVALNNMSTTREIEFTIENESYDSFTPYVTSKTKNCEKGNTLEVTDNVFSFTLEDSSITTFVSGEKITGVESSSTITKGFNLYQNYPNPFNPTTTIQFSIPSESRISLIVYDELGRVVKKLVEGNYSAGSYNVEFDGSALASGVYFYQLKAGDFVNTKKFVLLK